MNVGLNLPHNEISKFEEIWMFVCLHRDTKQCCDVTKLYFIHCLMTGHLFAVSEVLDQNNEYHRAFRDVTRYFGVSLENKKQQNLTMKFGHHINMC